MKLNRNTIITPEPEGNAACYALSALRRDIKKVFRPAKGTRGTIRLQTDTSLPPECYAITVSGETLTVCGADDFGLAYGLYEVSRRFLGVTPFWFWNDQHFPAMESAEVPETFSWKSHPFKVRYRGWFVNDETLLSHWKVEGRHDLPFLMAFEALLRCGGNMVIPGTGPNAHQYRQAAAQMGLILTHHHAEPLGAEMFAHAFPALEPMFSRYPEKFRDLWKQGIADQRGMDVVWNIGFRGQGDRPFWEDDPQFDTPQARGRLISSLIREQYLLVKESNPSAVCCTNLYGETMELYRDGCLELPEDIIKIWADNGFGKMVSRRQENSNPRVPALPPSGDTGRHGLYYHVSFYDLQAASHITMLPNSAEFVRSELVNALKHGADDYWLINCSNIKPHTYLLDLIAALWREGDIFTVTHAGQYAELYYGSRCASSVASCLRDYARFAVSYGPNMDDHAGDQFYNHVPRMLISQFLADRTVPAADLNWLCPLSSLEKQVQWCLERFSSSDYGTYLRQCEHTAADLTGWARTLFKDTVLLQARLYRLWEQGAAAVCQSLLSGFSGDYKTAFYQAGTAKRLYLCSYRALTDREHGKWIGFYSNECQTDLRQSADICGYLMSFLRNLGEGPHFYEWMREFQESEEERRVLLILNTEKHPDDDELWLLMEQRMGE